LDVPKPVADGVWIVDSGPLRVFGLLGLPIRMTALQLSSGDMLMHSPTRFDARLNPEIEAQWAYPPSRRAEHRALELPGRMAATVPGRRDLGSARPARARQREGFRRAPGP